MAATNSYNNISFITKAAMKYLTNNLVLTPRVNREYEDEFSQGMGKVGDTVNVRIPGLGQVTDGKVASPAGYYDTYKPITVAQKNASLRFSSKDLALNVETDAEVFERNVLGPQLAALVNRVEADGFALYSQIPNHAGTPGTLPADLQYFLDGKATIHEFAAPQDDNLFGFVSPRTESSMVYGQRSLFNAQDELSQMYKKGVLGQSGGITYLMSQNVKTHTVGTFSGAPAINGTTLEGATTLDIDGWGGATDSLKAGDIVTIAGVYAVNPVSKVSTGQLMQFVVTADYAATSNEMAALPISPAIYTSTSGPLQNVTALPANNALCYVYGSATAYSAKVSPANLILHKDAFGFACADLPMTTSRDLQSRSKNNKLGVSIRLSRYWDGNNDDLLYRADILYGWGILRERFGCRVEG